jgi:hypothetical protein
MCLHALAAGLGTHAHAAERSFSSAVTTPGGLVSGLQECLDGAAFVHGW